MITNLVPAERRHLPLLESMFQLYVYDFGEMITTRLGDDGRFTPTRPMAPYFEDDWRHPFLIRVDDAWAGFAFAHRGSRISGDHDTWDVGELFVMRGFRRSGVGAAAAGALFDRFPGRWEVRQIPENTAATAFWRRVIGDRTGGGFTEEVHDSERWRGPVQTFTSNPPR
jgi:predicted acetyltransferase